MTCDVTITRTLHPEHTRETLSITLTPHTPLWIGPSDAITSARVTHTAGSHDTWDTTFTTELFLGSDVALTLEAVSQAPTTEGCNPFPARHQSWQRRIDTNPSLETMALHFFAAAYRRAMLSPDGGSGRGLAPTQTQPAGPMSLSTIYQMTSGTTARTFTVR